MGVTWFKCRSVDQLVNRPLRAPTTLARVLGEVETISQNIWTPPALHERLDFWIQDRTADNISGLVMRPSTRA